MARAPGARRVIGKKQRFLETNHEPNEKRCTVVRRALRKDDEERCVQDGSNQGHLVLDSSRKRGTSLDRVWVRKIADFLYANVFFLLSFN